MTHSRPPNWNDVAWDRGSAERAIAAMQRAAAEIERALEEEGRHALAATAEWRGAARAEFDRRRARLRHELGELAAACRSAADQVHRAGVEAAAEQRRREREREEWERDQRRRRASGG